jgi:phage terminase large subunit-like protein
MHDLDHAAERYYFDADAAGRVLHFIRLLKHSKGKWGRGGGAAFVLEPWEQFVVWVAFGWKRKSDGMRRFRTLWLEVARKNGKSTLVAALGLYLAFADGEPAAEVYSASTKRDQSRIVHAEAVRFVRKNPLLKKYIRIYKDNLSIEKTSSKYEPLGADTDSTDGLNVHGVIADEVHQWKSREMWEVLETATGAREQPMIIAITTAGVDRNTLCFEKHEHTRRVLEGWKDNSYVDDTWFGVIYTLDDRDDWRDQANWVKANPNLGVCKYLDDMEMKAQRAEQMSSMLNNFLRRELNVWVHGEAKAINMEQWRACGGDAPALEMEEQLRGKVCYAGLDLGSSSDLTAFVMVFPDENETMRVVCRFWIPEDNMLIRTRDAGVMYQDWAREGYIQTTPGNVIDFDYIFEQIRRDADMYDIRQVAFDRWGAARVVTALQNEGLTMVQFGQGFASMSPPTKDLIERLIPARKIVHGNNPVLTWMADNLVVRVDPSGNIKPDKATSREKIDGIVALIMAVDLAQRNSDTNDIDAILSDDWGM